MVGVQSVKESVGKAIQQNDGDREITCAFDDSWLWRGFSSLNSVVTVTSVTSGYVVDVEVMSKFCQCNERLETQHDNYSVTSCGVEVERGYKNVCMVSRELWHMLKELFKRRILQRIWNCFQNWKTGMSGPCPEEEGQRLKDYKQKNSNKILSDGKKIGGQGRPNGICYTHNTTLLWSCYKEELFRQIDQPCGRVLPLGLNIWKPRT